MARLPIDDQKALRQTLAVLEQFRLLDPEMPIQQATAFTLVALSEGLTLKEVTARLGMATSSASRNIAALSKWHRLNRPGLDLVEAREDLADRRSKKVTLTPKGTQFRNALLRTMKDE